MTNEKFAFGMLLRAARIAAGRTQGEVARYLDLSVPYVSDMERGYRAPLTLDRLKSVVGFLGADASALLWARAQYYGVVEVPMSGDKDHDTQAHALAVRALLESKP